MTDKKLRRLRKTELLWIIRDQEAEIIELKQKLKSLGWEDDTDLESGEQADDESGSSDN
jgi:hypothetical protein